MLVWGIERGNFFFKSTFSMAFDMQLVHVFLSEKYFKISIGNRVNIGHNIMYRIFQYDFQCVRNLYINKYNRFNSNPLL